MLGAFVGLYFMYFHKGAPEDIMAANRRSIQTLQGADYQDDYVDEAEDTDDPVVGSRLKWQKFIRENNYVSIGELYNKCGMYSISL